MIYNAISPIESRITNGACVCASSLADTLTGHGHGSEQERVCASPHL